VWPETDFIQNANNLFDIKSKNGILDLPPSKNQRGKTEHKKKWGEVFY
jgi:hypothetical protein